MDTPDKSNTITTPLSKIEDSPVFNYINSLSPIKPVSLVHTGQSFQLLSFPSPQSLHTSPGIGCSTKPKETYASHLSDTSAPQSSNGGNEGNGSGLISDLCQPADAHAKIVDCVRSGVEVDASDECPDAAIDPSRSLIGICCSPGSQGDKLKSKSNINITGMGTSAAEVIQGSTEGKCLGVEKEVHGIELWKDKGAADCDLVKWVFASADHFLSDTPAKEKPSFTDLCTIGADTGTKPANLAIFQHPNEKVVDTQNSESMHAVCSAQLDGRETKETFQTTIHTSTYSYEEVDRKSSIEDDNMQSTPQTQLIRRRCLIFEMSGSHYRKLVSDSDSSSIAGQPSSAAQPDEKPLRSSMPGSAKFSSPLPGIGLHLNALRVTGSDDIIVKHGPVPSKRQLIRTPSTVSSDSITESAPTETGSGEGQELNQGSPKKKRRRSENIGETESCKRCNCKRSKCLKLYCECFAAGLYCVEPCSCQGCFNQPAHEQTVMDTRKLIESRNPLAFAPKVIKFSDCQEIGEELNKTPASARHKSGCNCRKSSCLKKYCECFQGGVGCSLSCRCEGCRNSFGRKDGTEDFILEETGPAGEIATEANIKYEAPKFEDGKEQQDIQGKPYSEIDRSCTCFLPPCFGERSSECPSLAVPLSLQPCSSIKSDQANFLSYQPNLGSHLLMIPEDETPDTLNDVVSSHHTGVKSVSPNSKRVSPPYRESGASSTFRSVRKLILKSMSPFPVLTTPNKHDAGLQQG